MGHLLVVLCAVSGTVAPEAIGPHLISVSFSVPSLEKWTDEVCRAAAATPYEAIGVRLHGAYEVGPAPTVEQFAEAVERVRSLAPGKVWPWVFLNRMIARSASGGHRSAPKVENEAEKAFAGMDLDGSGGALERFLEIWRTSLKLSRRLGAKGIVFDAEAYSDYGVNEMARLAGMRGISVPEARRQLGQVGAKMADICGEEFPEVVILSLFTQFERGSGLATMAQTLFDGLLRRAVEKRLPLELVDGGETVGYCMLNLAQLKRQHDARAWRLHEAVERYQGRLVLGATLAPWAEAGQRTGFLADWASCKNSELKTILDFEPLFVELLRRYRYLWIYGAGAAPYNPLKAEHQQVYDPVLARSLEQARRLGPTPAGAFALPRLDDLRPVTDDLVGDGAGWTATGGPEASLEPPTAEQRFVRFIVQVDHHAGDEKYPKGWLFLQRKVVDQDLRQAVAVSFDLRCHQEGMLRVGLPTADNGEAAWDDLYPEKVGQWRTELRPVRLLTVTDGPVTMVRFYVAEAWYPDRQRLVFDLRNVRFLAARQP